MNALPNTLRPDADEAPVAAWLYRSEAFAEDLSDWQEIDDAQDTSRSLPARLTWPLSAFVVCLALAIGFGL
jgi:hypothetical protein